MVYIKFRHSAHECLNFVHFRLGCILFEGVIFGNIELVRKVEKCVFY